MGKEILLLEARRDGYAVDQVGSTMTVGELIRFLEDYDESLPVYLSHDRGYTYGGIRENLFKTEYVEPEDEE